ncbi:shootin-1 [Diretmus argenteus]
MEQISSQLLKEMDALEMQFHIERCCRENAEALAVTVTKENKVLKRRSQMLMPLIPELPEDMATMTFDLETDPGGVDGDSKDAVLLQGHAKIAELQAAVDGLLADKLQLEQQVEVLSRELVQLREQLSLEVEEKNVIVKKMSKQNKSLNNIKRVSQLVTDEFTEMSNKLELEQDLRQQAEDFAHQMLVQQKDAHRQSVILTQSTDAGLQLQLALEQVAHISAALRDIRHYYHHQVEASQIAVDDSSILSELQGVRGQLEASEEERKVLETQLTEAHNTVKQLQGEVTQLQDTLEKEDKPDQLEEENSIPPPPPPPPPPPLPPSSTKVINCPLDVLRNRRKGGANNADQKKPAALTDMKAKAVDEMMERIKKGIVLRPTNIKPQAGSPEDDSSWKEQRSDKRKSAVLELKGMLDTMKHQSHRRAPSRKRISRNVGEAELLLVLRRRRQAMGDGRDPPGQPCAPAAGDLSWSHQPCAPAAGDLTWAPQPCAPAAGDLTWAPQPCAPAAGSLTWAGESSGGHVLRRLKHNREKRDSRIRASALIISQENGQEESLNI